MRLEKALVDAYRRLPDPNHLKSIPGIGEITAAILTAFIRDIDRFKTPSQLVAYFGAGAQNAVPARSIARTAMAAPSA